MAGGDIALRGALGRVAGQITESLSVAGGGAAKKQKKGPGFTAVPGMKSGGKAVYAHAKTGAYYTKFRAKDGTFAYRPL